MRCGLKIFVNDISRKAQVTTDKWKGYRPIAKVYDITQIESNNGLNFKELHVRDTKSNYG